MTDVEGKVIKAVERILESMRSLAPDQEAIDAIYRVQSRLRGPATTMRIEVINRKEPKTDEGPLCVCRHTQAHHVSGFGSCTLFGGAYGPKPCDCREFRVPVSDQCALEVTTVPGGGVVRCIREIGHEGAHYRAWPSLVPTQPASGLEGAIDAPTQVHDGPKHPDVVNAPSFDEPTCPYCGHLQSLHDNDDFTDPQGCLVGWEPLHVYSGRRCLCKSVFVGVPTRSRKT